MHDKLVETGGVLGLIAGGGLLPVVVAEGARRAGLQVVCVGLDGDVDPSLPEKVDVYYRVSVARPGSWIRRLRRHLVRQAVMVGVVDRSRLFSPRRIIRHLPDWRAFRVYFWRLRRTNRQTDNLLCALADELAGGGIRLEDSTKYCGESMAPEGLLTRHRPPSQADLDFGWNMSKRLGELDIGQAVAVKERQVIAVEAMEGTAQMIKRAGQLCRSGGWTLVKTAKPSQDMRFDVPCVGPDTITQMASGGGACLVIEAGRTIMLDKERMLELADSCGIAIVAR